MLYIGAMGKGPVRIAIVEDDSELRELLRRRVERTEGMKMVRALTGLRRERGAYGHQHAGYQWHRYGACREDCASGDPVPDAYDL